MELGPDFFEGDPVACARELIGARFRWHGCVGRIVETEAYAAVDDPACHTFFRKGAREFVRKHPAGTAYVYLNYGVHWLFNVLVKPAGVAHHGGFVLFRALEPLEGIGHMRRRRPKARADAGLCAGPGRLTLACGIDGSAHGAQFLLGTNTGISLLAPAEVRCGPRIGISRAQELPWRFADPNSLSLSRKI